MGGFKIRGVHVELHPRGVDNWAKKHSRNGGVLEATFVVNIMLCVNWVCAGTFDDHEWVSESAIAEQEEVMGRGLECESCIPCVVHWCMLWFSAPSRLNQTPGKNVETTKYHNAVNMAIAYAISRPFGGAHTPRSCILTTVATILHKTHRMWGSEQGDGRMGDGRQT